MGYDIKNNKMYMMPTHFGPMSGPRQGPESIKFECKDNPKSIRFSSSFLSNKDQLNALLPPNFILEGDPIVTVSLTFLKEIEWLAGRGYNTLGVAFPVKFTGKRDKAIGPFLTVLWENLTDPILTGREQLGFSKIYCELPEPIRRKDETELTASWLGFRFLDMHFSEMKEIPPENHKQTKHKSLNDLLTGTLHYKYIPKTGNWNKADAEYAVLTPSDTPNTKVTKILTGKGTVKFNYARWADMPTQYMIVNRLAELEQKKYYNSTITYSYGGKDLSDQRILR